MNECVCPNCIRKMCAKLCTTRISIFQSLPLHDQHLLVTKARHRQVPAGTVIFSELDPCEQILVIHSGRVKLNRYTLEGRETVLDMIGAGDIYGDQWMFSGRLHEVNAITMEPSNFCEIHRQDIETLILQHPQVGVRMLGELGTKLSRASRLQEIFFLNDAKARLAGYLLFQSREMKITSLSLSRDVISASINLRCETISRKLNEMAQEGLVELIGHKTIQIRNADGLQSLAEQVK